MNVAHGAADRSLRLLQNLGELGGVEITRRRRLDLGIAALRDQRRQPPNLKVESDDDEQVGMAQFQKKAGLGLDKMRVLIAFGDRFNVDLVAANLLRQRSQVRGGGNHVELLRVRR